MLNFLFLTTDVDILVNGKPIKKYTHKGNIYVEARRGVEYSVRIRNNQTSRRLACCAIDGLNVLDGKAAGDNTNGYVVRGYGSVEIKGWRVSDTEVHPFKFNDKGSSYARKSEETGGDTSNCGVIGVKMYAEVSQNIMLFKQSTFLPDTTWYNHTSAPLSNTWSSTTRTIDASIKPQALTGDVLRSTCDADVQAYSCQLSSTPRGFDMGTEFSKRSVHDAVHEVEFNVSYLDTTMEIFYASRESLLEMGVCLDPVTEVVLPKAFPSKFCKAPKW